MNWNSHNFKIREGREMQDGKQERTQRSAGLGETERGSKKFGSYGEVYSLNALMQHRPETSLLLQKRTLAEAPPA